MTFLILAIQPPRGKAIQTDPPARIEITNEVSQDVIFDFYEKHLKNIQVLIPIKYKTNYSLQAEKDKANTKQKGGDKENKNSKGKYFICIFMLFSEVPFSAANADDKSELGAFTAKVVERMLNQNTYDELADDFKVFILISKTI